MELSEWNIGPMKCDEGFRGETVHIDYKNRVVPNDEMSQ